MNGTETEGKKCQYLSSPFWSITFRCKKGCQLYGIFPMPVKDNCPIGRSQCGAHLTVNLSLTTENTITSRKLPL
jgi:hypothetical protein